MHGARHAHEDREHAPCRRGRRPRDGVPREPVRRELGEPRVEVELEEPDVEVHHVGVLARHVAQLGVEDRLDAAIARAAPTASRSCRRCAARTCPGTRSNAAVELDAALRAALAERRAAVARLLHGQALAEPAPRGDRVGRGPRHLRHVHDRGDVVPRVVLGTRARRRRDGGGDRRRATRPRSAAAGARARARRPPRAAARAPAPRVDHRARRSGGDSSCSQPVMKGTSSRQRHARVR